MEDNLATPRSIARRKATITSQDGNNVVNEHVVRGVSKTTLALLFAVGVFTALLDAFVRFMVNIISQSQASLIQVSSTGAFFFVLTSAALCGVSAYITKFGTASVVGSGMPEVKALLASDFPPSEYSTLVSFRILCIRVSSLILAQGSGLSVGSAGPLVHVSTCVAFVIMKFIPELGDVAESTAITKQIFAAAAAAGLAGFFNAPVGGLLLSVEVTSSYYLLSNYWRSFMAAIVGSVICSIVLLPENNSYRLFEVGHVSDPYQKWEFLLYALLGLILGGLAHFFLKLHLMWFGFVRPYVNKYPIATAAGGGVLTALIIYGTGGYRGGGVSIAALMDDLLNSGNVSEMTQFPQASPITGLAVCLIAHILLTLVGTTLRITAGIFMPMLLLGGLFGRLYGYIIQAIFPAANIYIGGYAMVGAVAFASGATRALSVAVMAVEMTGQLSMLLPCLIAAVIASGITKTFGPLSLYDQGMVYKGIETLELLLHSSIGYRYACDIMDDQVIYIPRTCSVAELFSLLESNTKQSTFPIVDNVNTCRLIGSIARQDIFMFLKLQCESYGVLGYIRQCLPIDTADDDARIARKKRKALHREWVDSQKQLLRDPRSALRDQGELLMMSYRKLRQQKKGGFTMMNEDDSSNSSQTHQHIWDDACFDNDDDDDDDDDAYNETARDDNDEEQGKATIATTTSSSAAASRENRRSQIMDGFAAAAAAKEKLTEKEMELTTTTNKATTSDKGNATATAVNKPVTTIAVVTKETSSSSSAPPTPVNNESKLLKYNNSNSNSSGGFSNNSSNRSSSTVTNPLHEIRSNNNRIGNGAGAGLLFTAPLITRTENMVKKLGDEIAQAVGLKLPDIAKISVTNTPMDELDPRKVKKLLALDVDVSLEPLLPINAFPFTSHYKTPVEQIFLLFEMLGVSCVFAVDDHKALRGMISKTKLLQSLKNGTK